MSSKKPPILTRQMVYDKMDGLAKDLREAFHLLYAHNQDSSLSWETVLAAGAACYSAARIVEDARDALPAGVHLSQTDLEDSDRVESCFPDNREKYPISKLIRHLQSLPPGTTYSGREPLLYGGQTVGSRGQRLGTSYRLNVDIVEGWSDEG